MSHVANRFFHDINLIIVDYLLLEFAKICGPATSMKGRRENFSCAYIVERIEWTNATMDELMPRQEQLQQFYLKIEPARNKYLAHYDKTTYLDRVPLGGFEDGADAEAIKTLEEMANLMHEASVGGVFGEMVVHSPGDVLDLTKALAKAVAFDQIVSNDPDLSRRLQAKLLEVFRGYRKRDTDSVF